MIENSHYHGPAEFNRAFAFGVALNVAETTGGEGRRGNPPSRSAQGRPAWQGESEELICRE